MVPPLPVLQSNADEVWERRMHVSTAAVCALVVAQLLPHGVAAERHIAAGAGHVCAVQDGGVVSCRGNGTTDGKLYPPVGVTFHAVTIGNDFSCGLTTNGSSLRCWGTLPGGTTQLPPPSTFIVDAHAGPRHVCGLAPNGAVLCYGNATSLGATNVPSGVTFQGVTAGVDYTCGVTRNHSVVCWGDNNNPVVAASVIWQTITDAEHVAAGTDHACYVRVNGSVACWGSNSRGAAAPPAALMLNGSVWWLAAGGGMTCAISGPCVPGPVTCWGTVSGSITNSGYEVACTGWGCAASTANSTARVAIAAAVGGGEIPQYSVVVTTLAGNGGMGTADGVGSVAQFKYPHAVSLDYAGGLYVADFQNYAIRRMDIATRTVTTVAGVKGSSGTAFGATPLQSYFNGPVGMEVTGGGDVYMTDYNNNAVRMLSGEWIAGTGAAGSVDAAAGTSATFNHPDSVRADVAGGFLYVADNSNNRVRTIAIAGTHATSTLATFTAKVFEIALNSAERTMYVAVLHSVYVVSYAGVSTLLVGIAATSGYEDGTGSAARFNEIMGFALDNRARVLYLTDQYNHRIRRLAIDGAL